MTNENEAAQTALDDFLLDDASPRTERGGKHRAPRDVPEVDFDETDLIDDLNPEQREVVLHDEGPCLVAAIAGSGKTTAVVRRVAYLVRARQISPENILGVTFSKKAADEMGLRLRKLGVRGARMGTWHSLCLQIMREERPGLLDEWEIDKRDRFKSIVKMDVLGYRAMDWKTADLGEVLRFIDLCKCRLAEAGTDEAAEVAEDFYNAKRCAQRDPSNLLEAYSRAQEELTRRRLITFSDMIVGAWKCLLDETVREGWADRWRYMIQDEAQDMNHAQEVIGEMLARDHRNYMLVGDPGQSIYGFRGSVPKRFLAFRDEWDAKTISMVRNYRSGPEILEAANGVISKMSEETHLGDMMVAVRDEPARVKHTHHEDVESESDATVAMIRELHADGMPFSSMACLYRTNAQSRGLEEQLLSARIPFVVIGGTNFYDRKEVKCLLAYLRVAAQRSSYDDLKKSMQNPFRYIGGRFFEELECLAPRGEADWPKLAREFCDNPRGYRMQGRTATRVRDWAGLIDRVRDSMKISDEYAKSGAENLTEEALQRVKKHMPAAILDRIVRETDYIAFLTRDEGSESTENNRASNVRELIRAAERFRTVAELLDYIDENIKASKAAASDRSANRVTLMSIHRSKGLEWPAVFVVGASEKIIPHGRAEDIEEERRLFYVALTRAKDYLHVSSLATAPFGAKLVTLGPSRFLGEAGLLEVAA